MPDDHCMYWKDINSKASNKKRITNSIYRLPKTNLWLQIYWTKWLKIPNKLCGNMETNVRISHSTRKNQCCNSNGHEHRHSQRRTFIYVYIYIHPKNIYSWLLKTEIILYGSPTTENESSESPIKQLQMIMIVRYRIAHKMIEFYVNWHGMRFV